MCAALLPCSSRLGIRRTQAQESASCSYLVPSRTPMRHVAFSSVQQPPRWPAQRCTRACAQLPQQQQQHEVVNVEPDQHDTPLPFSWQLWLAITSLPCGPALAEEALKYNPAGGETLIKSLTGIFYIGLVGYFLYKVLNRRARTAREQRIAGQGQVETPFTRLIEAARARPSPKATPVTALL